ncbi:hypothetical protein WJX72_004135 [[Myrmecia] bisecta]|uniref:Uncharacterized protein n=1 Tax=[Myrmecia] bisecta TaxID=41462 RepID=A0AAW1QQ16_9CHLO
MLRAFGDGPKGWLVTGKSSSGFLRGRDLARESAVRALSHTGFPTNGATQPSAASAGANISHLRLFQAATNLSSSQHGIDGAFARLRAALPRDPARPFQAIPGQAVLAKNGGQAPEDGSQRARSAAVHPNVAEPVVVWHIDSYEKLQPHGFDAHGGSNFMVYMHITFNKKSATLFEGYQQAGLHRRALQPAD